MRLPPVHHQEVQARCAGYDFAFALRVVGGPPCPTVGAAPPDSRVRVWQSDMRAADSAFACSSVPAALHFPSVYCVYSMAGLVSVVRTRE
jgi:hypothetical protein